MIKKLILCGLLAGLVATNIASAASDKPKDGVQALDQSIVQAPGWVRNYESTLPQNSCAEGMVSYWWSLFTRDAGHASIKSPGTFSKGEYYIFASYLNGQSVEDPVEKEELIDKFKPVIDRDHKIIMDHIKKKGLFLFVGDYDSGIKTLSGPDFEVYFQLPHVVDDNYDFESNTFILDGRTRFGWKHPLRTTHTDRPKNSLDLYDNFLNGKMPATAKEWRDHWSSVFLTQEGRFKIADRVLLDSKLQPVYGEVFDRETGAVLLVIGDSKKYQGKFPKLPYSGYNVDDCSSLNKSYFSAVK